MENESKLSRNDRFEDLVGSLVEESSLLPEKQLTPDEKIDIIQAIERNEVSLYVKEHASDKVLDAVHYLIAIYDELGKDTPDEDFIEQTIEELKGHL